MTSKQWFACVLGTSFYLKSGTPMVGQVSCCMYTGKHSTSLRDWGSGQSLPQVSTVLALQERWPLTSSLFCVPRPLFQVLPIYQHHPCFLYSLSLFWFFIDSLMNADLGILISSFPILVICHNKQSPCYQMQKVQLKVIKRGAEK